MKKFESKVVKEKADKPDKLDKPEKPDKPEAETNGPVKRKITKNEVEKIIVDSLIKNHDNDVVVVVDKTVEDQRHLDNSSLNQINLNNLKESTTENGNESSNQNGIDQSQEAEDNNNNQNELQTDTKCQEFDQKSIQDDIKPNSESQESEDIIDNQKDLKSESETEILPEAIEESLQAKEEEDIPKELESKYKEIYPSKVETPENFPEQGQKQIGTFSYLYTFTLIFFSLCDFKSKMF